MPTATEIDSEVEETTDTDTGAAPEKAPKTKPEVKSNPELAALITNYDSAAEQAQSFYVEMIDFIKKNNLSRAVVVKTLVEARKVEVTTATSQASRIFNIVKDDETFQALKNGEITLRAAREQTTKKRESSDKGKNDGPTTQEGKEKAMDAALQIFAKAAKATGMDLKSIVASVKATLQADPYNIK